MACEELVTIPDLPVITAPDVDGLTLYVNPDNGVAHHMAFSELTKMFGLDTLDQDINNKVEAKGNLIQVDLENLFTAQYATKAEVNQLVNDGLDALAPTIDESGYWVIKGEITGYKAVGADGASPTIEIGENLHWIINGEDSGVRAVPVAERIDYNGDITGARNEENRTFRASRPFDANSLKVYLSGNRMSRGSSADFYVSSDSGLQQIVFNAPHVILPEHNLIFEYTPIGGPYEQVEEGEG